MFTHLISLSTPQQTKNSKRWWRWEPTVQEKNNISCQDGKIAQKPSHLQKLFSAYICNKTVNIQMLCQPKLFQAYRWITWNNTAKYDNKACIIPIVLAHAWKLPAGNLKIRRIEPRAKYTDPSELHTILSKLHRKLQLINSAWLQLVYYYTVTQYISFNFVLGGN